jgi:16S rRNA processing protein RimM
MTSSKLIQVGIISGAHGVQGEVKIRSFTGDPFAILDYQPLSDKTGARSFTFKLRGEAKGQLIVRLDGVKDRNAAELLAHTELYVPRERIPEAEGEDDFLIEDLIGLELRLEDATMYGTVKTVMNFGAGDILEITPLAGGKTELLPFTRASFPVIIIDDGYITFVPPEITIVATDKKEDI